MQLEIRTEGVDFVVSRVPQPKNDNDGRQKADRETGAPLHVTELVAMDDTGSPQHPARAIEEIGMVQVHTCVSVHCDQCGDSLGAPGLEAHYPTEDAALDAAAAEGWRVGPGGRWWCSACAPVLICEAEGHEFSGWRHPVTRGGHPAGSEYRHCRRCCLHESRPAAPFLSGADVVGEVA